MPLISIKTVAWGFITPLSDGWGSYMDGRSARRSHSEVPDTEGYATSNPQPGNSILKSE